MPIYTRTGDKGTTSLFGGRRINKDDAQIEAYGSLDELSSFIGYLLCKNITKHDRKLLTEVQRNLYKIMSVLGGVNESLIKIDKHTQKLESYIDEREKTLSDITDFILPQGSEESALLHVVRTVCRRAERRTVDLLSDRRSLSGKNNDCILQYLNRLSDLFFVMAREYNKEVEIIAK